MADTPTVPAVGRLNDRRARFFGTIWAAVWLWPLFWLLGDMVSGKVHPVLPAAVGLAVFVVLYLVCITAGFDNAAQPARRGQLVMLAALAIIGLALIAGYADGSGGWVQLLLYVGAAGTSLFFGRTGLLWALAAGVSVIIVGLLVGQDSSALGASAFTAVLAGGLVFISKQMVGYIQQLRAAQAELARSAVAEERLRFARDLHELLGHTLTLIVVKAQVVRRLAHDDPEQAAAAATDIEQIGRQALIEVRETVTGYRERGFIDELAGAQRALRDAGIEVEVSTQGMPLAPGADSIFGWTVREGTTNVIRHSEARRCTITVRQTEERAILEMRDDGHGGSSTGNGGSTNGNGLNGLRERLSGAGGALAAGPDPAGGFRLVATLPTDGPTATSCGSTTQKLALAPQTATP